MLPKSSFVIDDQQLIHHRRSALNRATTHWLGMLQQVTGRARFVTMPACLGVGQPVPRMCLFVEPSIPHPRLVASTRMLGLCMRSNLLPQGNLEWVP